MKGVTEKGGEMLYQMRRLCTNEPFCNPKLVTCVLVRIAENTGKLLFLKRDVRSNEMCLNLC